MSSGLHPQICFLFSKDDSGGIAWGNLSDFRQLPLEHHKAEYNFLHVWNTAPQDLETDFDLDL